MARTTRQTVVFGVEDWKRIYQTYREADFQSYDFEALRKSFVDYLRQYYPETFNDYIESSEFIALLDVMAFMGQALSFRNDLNTRENYIDTAERRDSVVKLANLVSYTAKRNTAASGYLKVFSVQTTENITDFNGVNLANATINWNDPTNFNWFEQFTAIINAALIDSQRIGHPGNQNTIVGVDTAEYSINLVPGFLPVVPYSATVDGVTMPFEAVNSTSVGTTSTSPFIFEPAPRPNGIFNVLFRNDQLGYSSANTGFFFYFKQGVLQNQDFNLAELVPNRTVNINIEGVNNEDRWLFQLDNTGTIAGEWTYVQSVYAAAQEQLAPDQRKLYATQSRANDQITLTFGDGVFSTIPVGLFRCYVRASNGLTYIINPEEMQSVIIPISYISRSGQLQTITFTCGITNPVSNAQSRETLDEIKQRAPARYYTQNRMVNGEDYTNFPFTQYNSIIKSYALNRASIGTSRYLDLVDNTGKYSSTNIFSSDGAIWEENQLPTFFFTWINNNEIVSAITNQIQPLLANTEFTQFYYANFPRPDLLELGLTWSQSTRLANETTGYFINSAGNPAPVGSYSSSYTQFITVGSLIKFNAPPGYFFDSDNRLKLGVPTLTAERYYFWASPQSIYQDGTNQGQGDFTNGSGPVTLNVFVPTGAIPEVVIPILVTTFSSALQTDIINQIELYRNFGLGYDNNGTVTGTPYTWYLITSTNLAVNAAWSQANAGSTAGTNQDASWMIQVVNDGSKFTVSSRSLTYNFGSVLQTRFFFETSNRIYDPRVGNIVSDYINVLKTNSLPDSNSPLPNDIYLKIVGQPVRVDGLVDDYQVLISYEDLNNDGVTDDPDFFQEIVGVVPTTPNSNSPWVFFEKTVDFDNLQRYLLVEPGRVNSKYATLNDIEAVKSEYVIGKTFYAYAQTLITGPLAGQVGAFYQLTLDPNGVTTLVDVTIEWLAKPGRSSLYFQYRHNAPLTDRIDPGTSNIIDLYVVTNSYYTAYQNWIKDNTGTISEPAVPTINELSTAYQGLDSYKMISDNIVLNSVTFKPLFGPKAAENLRATIKVIRAANSTASASEIKTLVVANLNQYFDIGVWNFGDTFYFSELAAYIHRNMGSIVSSVVLVPVDSQRYFGDLYEIRSAPNEIFVNAAGVDSVEVITALTSTNIRTAPGSGVI
jgi:hypothetical protein